MLSRSALPPAWKLGCWNSHTWFVSTHRDGRMAHIIFDLPSVLIDMFDLRRSVRFDRCLRARLTFENPYLLSCRTKLEKLECLNVWGLETISSILNRAFAHSQYFGREIVHVPHYKARSTSAPTDRTPL
jgi:hypothetical protein